jgi:hypothetical protein
MSFPFLYIFNSLQSSLTVTFCQICLPVKETAEIETGMAEKSSWEQANIRQKLGLVWRDRKKISQIIKDYFYLPFFLLIILWGRGMMQGWGVSICTCVRVWLQFTLCTRQSYENMERGIPVYRECTSTLPYLAETQ